jgi:hypothetical protein
MVILPWPESEPTVGKDGVAALQMPEQAGMASLVPCPQPATASKATKAPITDLETKAKRSSHFMNFGADVLLSEKSDMGIPPETVD